MSRAGAGAGAGRTTPTRSGSGAYEQSDAFPARSASVGRQPSRPGTEGELVSLDTEVG